MDANARNSMSAGVNLEPEDVARLNEGASRLFERAANRDVTLSEAQIRVMTALGEIGAYATFPNVQE
jgi:hypothetical protein